MPHEWSCKHCEFTVAAGDKQTLFGHIRRHLASEGGGILVYNSSKQKYRAESVCTDLLTVRSPSQSGILEVTRMPEERLDVWESHVGTWPKRLHLLIPSSTSVSTDFSEQATVQNSPVEFTIIEERSLQKLGSLIAETTSVLSEACANVFICFQNLSGLINNFSNQSVFKFIHLLNAKARASGAFIHYHIIPETHIEATLHIFEQQFQLLLDYSSDDNEVILL